MIRGNKNTNSVPPPTGPFQLPSPPPTTPFLPPPPPPNPFPPPPPPPARPPRAVCVSFRITPERVCIFILSFICVILLTLLFAAKKQVVIVDKCTFSLSEVADSSMPEDASSLSLTDPKPETSSASRASPKLIHYLQEGVDFLFGYVLPSAHLDEQAAQVVLAANDLSSINDVTYPELVENIAKLEDDYGKLLGIDASNLLIANSGNDLPVVLAANDLPSINDVTYPELVENIAKLEDDYGKLLGVDASNLLIANSGNDLPVVLAANDLPSINDVTYPELIENIAKLKDDYGKLLRVDASNLLIANSCNDLPAIDLTRVSQELVYLASDADLVIREGTDYGPTVFDNFGGSNKKEQIWGFTERGSHLLYSV